MKTEKKTILSHKQDIHCVIFHILVLISYGSAFTIYLNADTLGLTSPSDLFAFILASALMLGWISGIDTGVNYHNHVHREIFNNKSLNLWFSRIWPIVSGWPAIYWKHAHITVHHKSLLSKDDWTLPQKNKNGEFESLYRYALSHWPWRYLPSILKDFKNGKFHFVSNKEFLKESMLFTLLWSIPFFIDPLMGLYLWLVPQFIANIAVMGPGMYAQHYGCIASDDKTEYTHSNTFLSSFFNNTMFNIGYHIEHHTWSNIHWSMLPNIHQQQRDKIIAGSGHFVPFGYYRGGHLLSSWFNSKHSKQIFMQQHPNYVSLDTNYTNNRYDD